MGGDIRFRVSPLSVSYTHLDVYKRQRREVGKLVQHPADCPEERDVVGRLYLAAGPDRF